MAKGFNLKKAGRYLKTGWNKNNQKILAVVAGACAIGAVVEAIRATPKATRISEARRCDLEDLALKLQEEEISVAEHQKQTREVNFRAAKEFALCYGTTMCMLALSLGSTACNYKISIGKQAMLMGAYKALEAKSGEFADKVKEVVGDKKLEEIKTGIVKDHLDKAEIPDTIKAPEYEKDADGNFLAKQYMYPCWEDKTGRPFMSSVTAIDIAMRKASARCYSRDTISLNEIFELLDPNGVYLPPNDYGEKYGFISQDLNSEKTLPYHTKAVDRDGFDHSFTALIFDKEPVNLVIDEDY